MRVLMLSWEYPPRIVGGIARHVEDLSKALVRQGVHVDVVTCAADGADKAQDDAGVKVFRVPFGSPPPPDFVTWVMQMNLNLLERAVPLAAEGADLVHAHDWLVAYAAKTLKHAFRIPLIATIHATEYGRNWGLHNDLQRYISSVEWWLGFESWQVICCSEYMRGELSWVFQFPADKMRVIPNGVDPGRFAVAEGDDLAGFRSRWAAPDEKMIFFIGRLVHEKGTHVLIEAFAKVLAYNDKAKLVIAGKGPADSHLRHLAGSLGIQHRIYFAGFVDDATRNRLYRCADIAVVPSLYEPFGITALEAMACRVPVVVSDTGGLGEVVRHGITGMKAYVSNPGSLADNILTLLGDDSLRERLQTAAYREIRERFNWDKIADTTRAVYEDVLAAYRASPWAVAGPRWFATRAQAAAEAPPDYSRYLVPEGVH
ncbi:MAG: glycosyltransferase family 4 protein [Bacillota bacterium]|nr:glycosyltransferase family 4 protein [Bacillota bacterium]